MLKVNLLAKKAKQPSLLKADFWLFLVALLLVIGASVGYSFVLDMRIKALEAVLKVKKREMKKMNSYQRQIKKLDKEVSAFKRRIEVIKKIRQKQNLPIIYLDVLVSHLPKRKLWFNSLQLNGERINFKGIALDNQILARYIEKLRRSPYVKKAAIIFTSRNKVDKYVLVSFECFVVMGNKSSVDNQLSKIKK